LATRGELRAQHGSAAAMTIAEVSLDRLEEPGIAAAGEGVSNEWPVRAQVPEELDAGGDPVVNAQHGLAGEHRILQHQAECGGRLSKSGDEAREPLFRAGSLQFPVEA